MRLRRYGESAVLAEVTGDEDVLALAAAARRLAGVVEVVPAARTALVVATDGSVLPDLTAALRTLDVGPTAPGPSDAAVVTLDVAYDGADLGGTAAELGLDTDALVRAHAGGDYVVGFCGFVPGFGYLSGLDPALHAGRLAEPRTRVPAGAVGIAGEFTGVYPRPSPGGWRLLGHTDAPLWDADRDPPALLVPGTRVRFRAVRR
ncbi:sensor histidine kinase inhibitor, KipI family [Jatrophihabitans endophyticus]|uniref:Sensor histidine kinase inhibitor, KipI family n=1 Tax=Jatrophihabitans endophyticus TaxID=1206085 RepID=A0A1M5MCZ3_9ACTN|nr:allophanate hydrolase subunit 1 [Jatrophihabitans endophyticus]SHG75188.1 sensor histidine kinase inhibitor, KipI family [Jatrophihabitans endophyticus]